jgi:hypothetical protein
MELPSIGESPSYLLVALAVFSESSPQKIVFVIKIVLVAKSMKAQNTACLLNVEKTGND